MRHCFIDWQSLQIGSLHCSPPTCPQSIAISSFAKKPVVHAWVDEFWMLSIIISTLTGCVLAIDQDRLANEKNNLEGL